MSPLLSRSHIRERLISAGTYFVRNVTAEEETEDDPRWGHFARSINEHLNQLNTPDLQPHIGMVLSFKLPSIPS